MRQKLGLEAEAPDEYTVYDRAPLSVPPKFALRPPRPGALPSQEVAAPSAAQKILNRGEVNAPRAAADSQGKEAFLKEAGAQETNKDIRTELDKEILLEKQSNTPKPLQDVLFWQKKEPQGKVLDPVAEKKRLESGQTAPKD